MCVVLSGGKVGVAYYQVETAFLYVMPDVAEAEDLGLLQRGECHNYCSKYAWVGEWEQH